MRRKGRRQVTSNFNKRRCEDRKAKVLIFLLKLFATISNKTFGENQVTNIVSVNAKIWAKTIQRRAKKKFNVSRETNQITTFSEMEIKRWFCLRF